MYRSHYAEVLEDDAQEARGRERAALSHAIELMETAQRADGSPVDRAQAIVFTNKLWTVLIEDLADPQNGLSKELRAQIISIGIWILGELERLRLGDIQSFADLIAVSKAIRDGVS